MAGMKDRIKGKTNESVGAARRKVGEATDDEKMQDEGAVQEMKGKGQSFIGKLKGKLS